ncbi:MAG: Asp-tRNA(Asn)/Glu-tRNA(Gln) amidotransferase subunit GatB, partial [Bacteriovoracaceae bacterium]|nr:Asp-tRNA(Asn)/Glu-tRNA(Gln) amidotransferase subunit GatB [Bacteriovoracaceae bacterium]
MHNVFDVVIGLEVHAQLSTKTKMWCHCEIAPLALENTKVCEVCSGQPGVLPVLNKKAVEAVVKLALATNCKINEVSFFDRKNYFYPDLPKGYQITQFHKAVAEQGFIIIPADDGHLKKIRITRIQMEEDTGKSTHTENTSLINLNRSGTPLLEIVGEPDIASGAEASRYLKKLLAILTYLDINHGNLQDGNFRCDVNLSLKAKGSDTFGTRTEVKNLNSFKSVEKAIESEIKRQSEILKSGGLVLQETLHFDIATQVTSVLRSKSDAHDYRYMGEPDLLPLRLSSYFIESIKKDLPELPDEKAKRFCEEYHLPIYDAGVLTSDQELANYFETAVKSFKGEAKKVSNWIMAELLKLLNQYNVKVRDSAVSPQELSALLNLVHMETISGKIAKDVFEKMYDEKKTAQQVIQELGLQQIGNTESLEEIIQIVLQENPKEVERYRAGEVKLMGF